MTVPAPYSLPATTNWQVADWLDRSASSAPAGSDGVATITLDTLDSATRWLLTHAVAGCVSSASPQMRLYLDSASNANLRDGTNSGGFDVADWPAGGLQVPPNRALVARWTGCNTGDVAYLNYQATVLRLVGS